MFAQIDRHGGNIRAAVEKYRIPAERIMDFSANINPLGPPAQVKSFLCSSVDLLRHYPDPECKALRSELAEHLRISPEHVLVGNGSVDLIYLICHALRPRTVLIPVPTFSEYEHAARAAGAKCGFVENKGEEDFRADLEKCRQILPRVDVLFLCNPNNPTGHLLPKEEVLSLVEACRRQHVTVLVDEAFMDFVDRGERVTLVKEASRRENLLVLRSLTKLFALPGLRIGYVIGSKQAIRLLTGAQAPWSVNGLAQTVGRKLIKDRAFIKRSIAYLARERRTFYQELKKIESLHPYQPAANFIFCELSSPNITSTRLCHDLGEQGILIRDCANVRGLNNRFVRMAVRKREENRILTKTLKEVLYHGRR